MSQDGVRPRLSMGMGLANGETGEGRRSGTERFRFLLHSALDVTFQMRERMRG